MIKPKLISKLALVPLLVAICGFSAIAQPPGENSLPDAHTMKALPGADRPGSDPLQLLQLDKVQTELELTDTQVEKLKEIDQQARSQLSQRSRSAEDQGAINTQIQQTRLQIAEVLEPSQLERFREILLQVNGWTPEAPAPRARGNTPEDPLNLDPQMQEEFASMREKTVESMRGNFARTRATDPEQICNTINANREKIEPLRNQTYEQAMENLSLEQRATLEKLKGESFQLEPPGCNP